MSLRTIIAAGAAALALGNPALADDIVKREAAGSVAEVMDRLVAAVEGAGATVFARVDHAGGARAVGMELADSQLLIFGNPKLGTPAMQQDILAGLVLPLRVLVYAGEGGTTVVAYEEVEEMFEDYGVDDDAEFVGKMEEALEKLTTAAAG